PEISYATCRYVKKNSEDLYFNTGVYISPAFRFDEGIAIQVMVGGSAGYAATSNISKRGIAKAFDEAILQAKMPRSMFFLNHAKYPRSSAKGEYISPLL